MEVDRILAFKSRYCLVMLCFLALAGCASSSVSDTAANHVDAAYQNTASFLNHVGDNGVSAYPNTSGVVQGGVSGAIVGASVVGFGTASAGGALVGGAGGAVIGGILGAYLNQHASYVEQLENHGAKVFVLGDQVMIVIPSVQVFREMTPTLYPAAENTLDLIASMVRGYRTMSIKVSVYTDGCGADRVYLALSQQQANTIVRYLWPRVDTRLLYGAGYGNTHLVEKTGGAMNPRIEITLEKLPA